MRHLISHFGLEIHLLHSKYAENNILLTAQLLSIWGLIDDAIVGKFLLIELVALKTT